MYTLTHIQPRLPLTALAAAVLLSACADLGREEPSIAPPPAPKPVATPATVPVPAPDATGAAEIDADTGSIAAARGDAPVSQPLHDELARASVAQSARQLKRESKVAESFAGAGAGQLMAYAPAAPMVAVEASAWTPPQEPWNERYQTLTDNPVKQVAQEPVSTFSLDVDTGSYSNVRRMINAGQLPPKDAVRVEEMINYFPYDYPRVQGEHPFGVGTELTACPWNPQHWLMRVAVRADEIHAAALPPANLVFLVDVSGSMGSPDKLPLLQKSLKLLVDQLRAQDRVSLVVYAGREAVVLEPTPGSEQAKIRNAIDQLTAGGSTAGEAGIKLAYRMARQGYIKGGINRVLLATDGDFNVGVADTEQLKSLVERERASGVSLSTLGFGTGNYNEAMMEQIADIGNGNYSYIDTLQEGRKVLVDQMTSTLATVAKDVKVQVEFNPGLVAEYRLVGYENRLLNREDFNNDAIDAGEVGAGASVTALYEITPVGATPSVDALRYGATPPATLERVQMKREASARDAEIAFVRLRYKQPEGTSSRLMEMPVQKAAFKPDFSKASEDLRFAAAVAGFGQVLRGGRQTGRFGFDDVLALATGARGKDEYGYRSEFLGLVRTAKSLNGS